MPVIWVQEESFASRKAAEAYLLTLRFRSSAGVPDEQLRSLGVVDPMRAEL